jgi:hypothetical protein
MAENYPQEQYPQDQFQPPYAAPPAKKKLSPWVIVLIVVVVLLALCCLCVCGVLTLAGPQVGNVFSSIIETLEVMTPVP